MRKYLIVAKMALQEYFIYRLNFWLEMAGSFILMLATVAVWYAVFTENGESVIGGYTLPQMITYLLGAGFLGSFILNTQQGDDINDDIHLGRFSHLIIKPINAFWYWLSRDLSRDMVALSFSIISFVIILSFFTGLLVAPVSMLNLIVAGVFFLLGAFLHFLIFYVLAIGAFWLERTWSERFVIRIIMEIAMGSLIPLSLFAPFWKSIFYFLPFRFLAAVPMELYLGKIDLSAIPIEFLKLLIWLIIVAAITTLTFRRGIRHYSAVGG